MRVLIEVNLSDEDLAEAYPDGISWADVEDSIAARIEDEAGYFGPDGVPVGCKVVSVSEAPFSVEAAIERSKREILADLAEGVVNSKGETMTADKITSFSDLHDYVDANEYGGLCDDDWPFVIGSDEDPAGEIQDAIDQWLRAGGHHKEVERAS